MVASCVTMAVGRQSCGAVHEILHFPVMKLAANTQLAHYHIINTLGAGGMGEVYLARDTRLGREVAIKVLSESLASDPGWRSRFLKEAQVLASLNHPSIATIYGLENAPDGTHYLVLERVEGETLASKLSSGALPVKEALEISGHIAAALGAAHARGIVHRDLKPGNVMLTPDSKVKLLDFGLASSSGMGVGADSNAQDTAIEPTRSVRGEISTVTGTPGYMSPEQVRGEAQDRRTDVFSFGCVLFECLAGRKAFTGKSAAESMGAVLYAEPDLGSLPAGTPSTVLRLLGRCLEKNAAVRLRDIEEAVREIETSKGSGGARMPAAAGPPRQNLPRPRTSFLGREKEIAECVRHLSETRVLTLTGVGGCGKTRLALRVAEERFGAHDGVWFVDFAPIQDGERVPVAVATALGVMEEPGGSLTESLSAHLAGRDVLLVLDNCEHVLSATAELADALLASAPGLRILATSREGLGLDGEQLIAVRSLSVPRRDAPIDAEAIESSEAMRLFVDRARASDPRFTLDARNGSVVAEICRRLDGIPLAIELAASRVKVLSVEQIRSKLDDRFRLLTGGHKSALPRHQTLRATMQWSYDQLSASEQRLLRGFAAFAGGWTLEGATAVAGDSSDEYEVLDQLTRLVDKSVVVVERDGSGEPRYRMLETVRQFAEERLSESGESGVARDRHLDFYVRFLTYAEPFLGSKASGTWLRRLDAELENILAALERCETAPDGASKALRIAGPMRNYWEPRGLHDLAIKVSSQVLARGGANVPHEIRRNAMLGYSTSLLRTGKLDECDQLASRLLEESTAAVDKLGIAGGHRLLGAAAMHRGNLDVAHDHLDASVAILKTLDEPGRLSSTLGLLGEILRTSGRYSDAKPVYEESLALARKGGDLDSCAIQLLNLASLAIDAGDLDKAGDMIREALEIAEALAGKYIGTFAVLTTGIFATLTGDAVTGARFIGAALASGARMGVKIDPVDQSFIDPYIRRTREALGAQEYSRLETAGAALSFEEAMAESRAWLKA